MRAWIIPSALAVALIAGCAEQGNYQSAQNKGAGHPYSKPLSTPGARFGSLPSNVQTTVLSEAGTAEIADVSKEIVGDRVVYKIFFQDPRNFPTLLVGADGSVLNPDMTIAVPARQLGSAELKPADLPPSVSKVIQEQAPKGEIASIVKETWGNHIVYVITFKDETHNPKLHIVADGTLLHQS